jgi:hypothetical protein
VVLSGASLEVHAITARGGSSAVTARSISIDAVAILVRSIILAGCATGGTGYRFITVTGRVDQPTRTQLTFSSTFSSTSAIACVSEHAHVILANRFLKRKSASWSGS